MGFPIRTSPDQCLFSSSPKLFAAIHALHHLSAPRYPPYALSSLTIITLIKEFRTSFNKKTGHIYPMRMSKTKRSTEAYARVDLKLYRKLFGSLKVQKE